MKLLILVACVPFALLAACNQQEPSDGPETGEASADSPGDNLGADMQDDAPLASAAAPGLNPTWTYENVRAEVVKLPDVFTDLTLHHEHIPDFVAPMTGELHINSNGATGMRAMQMPFPPAEGVDISGLRVGDKLEVDLGVWGPEAEGGFRFAMIGFRRLPGDTVLDYADKPAAAPDDAGADDSDGG